MEPILCCFRWETHKWVKLGAKVNGHCEEFRSSFFTDPVTFSECPPLSYPKRRCRVIDAHSSGWRTEKPWTCSSLSCCTPVIKSITHDYCLVTVCLSKHTLCLCSSPPKSNAKLHVHSLFKPRFTEKNRSLQHTRGRKITKYTTREVNTAILHSTLLHEGLC